VIVEMKSRNPQFGYLRIARQISLGFGLHDPIRRQNG